MSSPALGWLRTLAHHARSNGTPFGFLPPPSYQSPCPSSDISLCSLTMPRAKEPAAGTSTAQAQQDAVSDGIDNFELPRSLIMKLARASQVSIDFDASNASIRFVYFVRRSDVCQVPENTKFSKDVILSILKASTVFVNYLGTPPLLVGTSTTIHYPSSCHVRRILLSFNDPPTELAYSTERTKWRARNSIRASPPLMSSKLSNS